MKLNQRNKDDLIEALMDWHTEAYYANRYLFDKDENENDVGKNYIKFEAMLKVIKKLIREAK